MLFCISVSLHYFQDGASDLTDLINYFEAKKQDIASDVEGKFYHMSSFDESTARSYINDPEKGPQFVKYNCRQMSRLYPGGIRQDSSNLNPLSGWNAGCQMGKNWQPLYLLGATSTTFRSFSVALNYQTEDPHTFLNRAKFKLDNGGCGYVLKPEVRPAHYRLKRKQI